MSESEQRGPRSEGAVLGGGTESAKALRWEPRWRVPGTARGLVRLEGSEPAGREFRVNWVLRVGSVQPGP